MNHHVICPVVGGLFGRIAFGIIMIGIPRPISVGDPQEAPHEVTFCHAMRAHHAKPAMFIGYIQVGMKGQRRTRFIFQQGRLEIDNVTVRGERVICGVPDRLFDVEDFGR